MVEIYSSSYSYLWKQRTSWQFSKQISKLSFQLSIQVYSLLGQTEGEMKIFLEGARKRARGAYCAHYLQEHLVVIRDWKVSPFVKFEIILPLFFFLLYPLTNNHCRSWSSIINLWIDTRTCQKLARVYFALVPPSYFMKWNHYFSACENLPNSSCHFWKHKSVFLQILHQSS